jgi:8-oxo-dGTP diphosphatase
MRHRIRAAALITRGDSILLVKHRGVRDPGNAWWVSPGGGVEGAESLVECAAREVREETGLEAGIGEMVYIREFVEPVTDTHHIEVFFTAEVTGGVLAAGAQPDDNDYVHEIEEVRFVRRDELAGIKLYPAALVTEFWDDLAAGFPAMRYLGLEVDDG